MTKTSSIGRLVLSVATTLGALAGAAYAQGTAGVAAAVNPQATGTPPAQAARILEVGADVVRNERIATGPDGQLQLLFRDGSTLTMGPSSDLVVDSFVYDSQAKTARLAMTATAGVFRFVGGRASKDEPVVITTPNATIGIRGGINYTTVEAGTGVTSTSQAYGRDTTATARATGHQQVIARNGFTMTIGSTGDIVTSKFDINRLNQMLVGLQGRSGATGGAASAPDQNSPQAQQLSAANSAQPPSREDKSVISQLGKTQLPNTNQLVAQTSQTIQTGQTTSITPFASSSYGFGLASPAIRSREPPVTAGGPFAQLSYTQVTTPPGSTTTTTNQTSVVDVTLSNGIPTALNTNNARTDIAPNGIFGTTERISATLNAAKVTELGGDNVIQFGRLTGGNAVYTQINSSTFNGQSAGGLATGPISTSLASNQSSHYVIGVPVSNLPTAGNFNYSLVGATSPTFADGSGLPGTFTGNLNIAFGQQVQPGRTISGVTGIVVGMDATVTMPGDAAYRILTPGGLTVAQQIAQINSGLLVNTITGFNALSGFSGRPIVLVTGTSRACGSSACDAIVVGFLAGNGATRAGLVYALGSFSQQTGQFNLSQIIQGAAAFRR